jgi:acyl-CoA synthetase (AMP-forming)/AMP-acid ligase II
VIDFGSVVSLGARRTPDRIAIKEKGGRGISFRDLDERSNRLAHALTGLGLKRGDRAACWLEDSIEYVETYAAVAKAGLTLVALNTRMTAPEAAYQLEQSRSVGLLYSAGLLDRVAELPELKSYISLAVVDESVSLPSGTHYGSALAGASASALPAPDPDAPFMICYTSGTTGRPKGAVLTHRSVKAVAHTQLTAMRVPIGGVNCHAVSMCFPATVTCHLIPTLMNGGTSLLVAGSWNTDAVLDVIHREQATFIYLPGPVLGEFADLAGARPERWQSLTGVLHAGSRADPQALERLADVIGSRYIEGWGMTENSGGVITATSARDYVARDRPADFFSSVGCPVPGAAVVAVNSDGTVLPRDPDAVGELKVSSESLFSGYFGNPEATAKVLNDGWYMTGDIGSVGPDGRVYISDRRTNMIASGGMNVYPAEIELVLQRCPGIAEVAVLGQPHERWGETPVAVVVRAADSNVSEKTVTEFARANLASYKKPTRVIFIEEMPRTVGGKLARPALKALVEADGKSGEAS